MRAVFVAIGFFTVIVITLVYKLPARFVYQQLPHNHFIQLNNISGSIWSGQIGSINTPQLTLNNFSWDLSFWTLFVGDIDVQWRLDDAAVTLQGAVKLSGQQLRLTNMTGHIDLVELATSMPTQVIVLGGQIDLVISKMEFKQDQLTDAMGSIAWKPARVLLPNNIELSEFKANLSSDSGQLLIGLADMGGAVTLQGEVKLSLQGAYHYDVAIGVRDTSVLGLLDGFNQLGRQDKNGLVQLRGQGILF